jgi:hypothetical protein
MSLNHDRFDKDEVRAERNLRARRKYYKPSPGGTNFVVLDADVARVFRPEGSQRGAAQPDESGGAAQIGHGTTPSGGCRDRCGLLDAGIQNERENNMPISNNRASKWTTMIAIAVLGLFVVRVAPAAELVGCANGPVVKNLMALSTRPCAAQAPVRQQLTKKEVEKLTATARSTEDHLKLAGYYGTKADRLDAEGAAYEEAAAAYRHGPMVKNLLAPDTPARYDYLAKGFREEAKAARALAASQVEMAKNADARPEVTSAPQRTFSSNCSPRDVPKETSGVR